MEVYPNMTVDEVCTAGVICPLCKSVDRFYLVITETVGYEKEGEQLDQVECEGAEGLLSVDCSCCSTRLISRTLKEALAIEEIHSE